MIAAVLVGALILAKMSAGPHLVTTTKVVTTTTRPQSLPLVTTPKAAAHSPSSVNVLVLNGVDPKKAIAKPAATTVAGAGFATLPPRDAAHVVTASAVYFAPGYPTDAATVAAVLSIPPAAVVALPSPVPTEIGDPAGAQVVVVIGPDLPISTG